MLKVTPLNAVHRAAGARMVDFGGWDMPVHYGSQIEEHHAVRRGAGVFDVSHMRVLDLSGEGSRDFLRYALANDVARLTVAGKALYSCLLRPDGGVIDDLIVYLRGPEAYRLVVNAGTAEKDVHWLRELLARHAPGLDLGVRTDLAMIAVQGPSARARVWEVLPQVRAATEGLGPFTAAEVGRLFIGRTGYTGEDGFEIVLPAVEVEALWHALVKAGVLPCGLGARDTLRLEAGMNLYGQDMDESVSPMESGLAWTVDLRTERTFVGREAITAARPHRQLVGLVLEERGGVLRSHQVVHTAHGPGEITSGTFSPTLGCSIALARLPAAVAIGDRVDVGIREKRLAARVVKPPFVRHGKSLITTEKGTP